MDNSFDVFIGNLPATVSLQRLKNLFSEVGKILFGWIKLNNKIVTFGFIGFEHLADAKKASERFNNHPIDNFKIEVRLSKKTEQKLNQSVRYKAHRPNNSVLLELPKKTGETKTTQLRHILRRTLVDNPETVKDFTDALYEMDNVESPNKLHTIKTDSKIPTLETLKETVKRYYKPCEKKNSLFKVDFDLSKGKVLTNEQYNKFFNICQNQ